MLGRLPNFIDPHAFADKRRQLSGEIALKTFSRLSEAVPETKETVKIELSFFKNKRLTIIQGTLRAEIFVNCQSCLKIMPLPLNITVNLAVLESLAQAEELASEYDPLILDEKKLSLTTIVEDEILLAMPDFPRHTHVCLETPATPKIVEAPKTNNPFSILAPLKNTGDLSNGSTKK
jgi:uncharacterized protein